MIIVEPIKLGAPLVDSGGGSYFDRDGVLQTAPRNTLRVTYDPSDLSKAPYALIEPEAANRIRNNTMQGGGPGAFPTNWSGSLSTNGVIVTVVGVGVEDGVEYLEMSYSGIAVATTNFFLNTESLTLTAVSMGQRWEGSAFLKLVSGTAPSTFMLATSLRAAGGGPLDSGVMFPQMTTASLARQRFAVGLTIDNALAVTIGQYLHIALVAGEVANFSFRIGLPQLEREKATSPIKTSGTAVTRAADVVGAGAGLVFSNVPIAEAAYDVKATYAKDAQVYNPITYQAFQSLVAGNVGKALDDTSAWAPRGAINRRAMFDDYNNTQTVMPDEILVVLTPEMVAQGLYLGNLDVHELRVSMVDALDGVVYSEVISLIESNSQSSYFNWMFKRIKRRTYFFVLDLPVYANALVTISLRKIGAEAKVGMCAIGPVEEFGPSLLGLSTEGKDFSSTTFNFDGTSTTTIRPYAKRMSCDVVVPNDEITYVQDRLFELRQRPLVWVGGPYGATAVFGRYGSFKNVIEYQMQSKMNLVIEGAV